MAREGIYIGGREIVERYVGDKLVWKKWKFLGSWTLKAKGSRLQHAKTISFTFSENKNPESNFDSGEDKPVRINYSNKNGSWSMVIVRAYYVDYFYGKELVLDFKNPYDADEFNGRVIAGTKLEVYK